MHTDFVNTAELLPRDGEDVFALIKRLRSKGIKTPTTKMIKSPEDIKGCREAGRINSLVLDRVEREICVGMSTEDINEIVLSETKKLGAKPACLGYEGFPKAVCTSRNNVICHGIPSKKEKILEGDVINVDCTTFYEGYYGDASRMFTFGKISSRAELLVKTVRESLEMAVSDIKPYTSHLGDIGSIINRLARSRGFSVVREIGGHGVGLKMHEDPYVCHTGIYGSGMVLLPGMIFTIEPMINEGTEKVRMLNDGWGVVTADGKLSAHYENSIAITDNGVLILTKVD